MKNKNFYELLGTHEKATPKEITLAYHQAKETYGPDQNALYSLFTNEEIENLNTLLDEAHETLKSNTTKLAYDTWLHDPKRTSDFFDIKKTLATDPNNQIPILPTSSKPELTAAPIDMPEPDHWDGVYLQKARQLAQMSLEDMSKISKISKSYILSVESHDFDNLPARVFIRGFVTQISKILNLDSEKVVSHYLEMYDKALSE